MRLRSRIFSTARLDNCGCQWAESNRQEAELAPAPTTTFQRPLPPPISLDSSLSPVTHERCHSLQLDAKQRCDIAPCTLATAKLLSTSPMRLEPGCQGGTTVSMGPFRRILSTQLYSAHSLPTDVKRNPALAVSSAKLAFHHLRAARLSLKPAGAPLSSCRQRNEAQHTSSSATSIALGMPLITALRT